MSYSFATPWAIAHQAPLYIDFPGNNTGVGCYFLLQGVFLTQESNLGLPHCQAGSSPLRHLGCPKFVPQLKKIGFFPLSRYFHPTKEKEGCISKTQSINGYHFCCFASECQYIWKIFWNRCKWFKEGESIILVCWLYLLQEDNYITVAWCGYSQDKFNSPLSSFF